jgi:RNA polymerase sigma-70 factor, ECF subfamily
MAVFAIADRQPGAFAAAPDAELVAAVRRGDPRAQRELYDRHLERVYSLALRRCGERERAGELTQSAFVRVFDRIHQFRGEAALSTWIHRVALSVIHSEMRRSGREEARTVDIEAADEAVATPSLLDPWLRERLTLALSCLTDRLRTVFLMHDLEGYTHEEIGRACGIAQGTSKADLHRARRTLRVHLSAYARECA